MRKTSISKLILVMFVLFVVGTCGFAFYDENKPETGTVTVIN